MSSRFARRDAGLLRQLETAMGAFRAAISKQTSLDEVQRQAHEIDRQLDDASAVLDEQGGDAVTVFVGSLTILLREDLEAMLIVVGIIAFLSEAERKDALRYVHAGWVSALFVGGLIWVMATWLIVISSLFIAVVAAVLAGKGVAALQEAGWVAQGLITLPRIGWIGLYPTWQTVATQLVVILVAMIGFWINARNGKTARA